MGEILAADVWPNNGVLIRDGVKPLGFIKDTSYTLDSTHGLGTFWNAGWTPNRMKRHDIVKAKAPDGVMDYHDLAYDDGTFDVVVFDPDYKYTGTPPPEDERYGVLRSVPKRWQERRDDLLTGMAEQGRVTVDGGIIMVKCQSQNVSGHFEPQEYEVWEQGVRKLGWKIVTRYYFLGSRSQSFTDGRVEGDDPDLPPTKKPRKQKNPRNNLSCLMLFRKPKPRKRRS